MKQLRLIWTMLWRSPGRTILTALSVVVAFFLFATLTALKANFSVGADLAAANNITVTHNRGLAEFMPMRHADDMREVEGVRGVSRVVWLGLAYQEPTNQIQALATDPEVQFEFDDRLVASDGALEALAATRTSPR